MSSVTRYAALRDELALVFSDWEGDFDIDIEPEDHYSDHEYFSVVIRHEHIGVEHHFTMRMNADRDCEMCVYEDIYQPITKGNVFASMWFDATRHSLSLAGFSLEDNGNG